MITACLLILAWAVDSLPLWARVVITVLASVRFVGWWLFDLEED